MPKRNVSKIEKREREREFKKTEEEYEGEQRVCKSSYAEEVLAVAEAELESDI